jgi:hypothetical protein
VVTLDRLNRSPPDAAVLHDAKGGARVAVQKPHPGIDDEDMKAVMRQHAICGGDRIQQSRHLPLERRTQLSQQPGRRDLVQRRTTDPVAVDDVLVECIGGAHCFRNGR